MSVPVRKCYNAPPRDQLPPSSLFISIFLSRFVRLFAYLPVCLCVCVSACLCVCLSVCLCVYVSMCLCVCLSLRLSVCLPVLASFSPPLTFTTVLILRPLSFQCHTPSYDPSSLSYLLRFYYLFCGKHILRNVLTSLDRWSSPSSSKLTYSFQRTYQLYSTGFHTSLTTKDFLRPSCTYILQETMRNHTE